MIRDSDMIEDPDRTKKPAEPRPAEKVPPEGPHADPQQVDRSKTPGSGMFPKPGQKESEPPSG